MLRSRNLIFNTVAALFGAVLMFLTTISYGEIPSIKREFRNADPVNKKDSLSPEAKTKVYQAYLDKAIRDKDVTRQFYGHLFLYNGYYNQLHDYQAAAACVQQADSLAQVSGLPAWTALVELRKGALTEVQNNDYAQSLSHYKKAVAYAIQAGDSLCVGESLEQVSSMFTMMGKSDSAHFYLDLALPILRRYADAKEMEVVYFNYALMLEGDSLWDDALSYMDSAMAIDRSLHDLYKEMSCQTAKATIYAAKGDQDRAIRMYKEVIVVSKAHNWLDRLEKNYLGLMYIYEQKGDFHSAYDDLTAFYMYKDSMINEQVQLTIAKLSTTSDALQKQVALNKANEALHLRNFALIILLVAGLACCALWYLQAKNRKAEISLHQDNLQRLTQLLAEKNAMLAQNVDMVQSNVPAEAASAVDVADFENNLYNQRILTYEDWFLFKGQFEKAYPGYLPRLKKTYATLTEAEERMFLLVKLKLKNKDISAILGISTDSVKKTKARLKKRMELAEDVDLERFVEKF